MSAPISSCGAFLRLIAICLFLPVFSAVSCTDDDGEAGEVTPGEAVADSTAKRNEILARLLSESDAIAQAGEAYNVKATTAGIPVRFNAPADRLKSAQLVLLLTDKPSKSLELGKGCKEVYIDSDWLDENGVAVIYVTGLIPASTYRYCAYYRYNTYDTAVSDEQSMETVDAVVLTAEAVDLGLSVKWASWNLGAARSYQPGRYYMYGQPESWDVAKAGSSPSGDIAGTSSDPAAVELGDGWQSPTVKHFAELIQKCRWVEGTEGGVSGYLVFGKGDYSGNYIFIPKAGYYNSNGTLTSDGSSVMLWGGQAESASKAWTLNCAKGSDPTVTRGNMDYRMPLRPVYVK